MRRKKIYCVLSPDGCTSIKTGKPVPFFTFSGTGYKKEEIVTGQPTTADLVNLCDQDAENRNAHDFCGVHKALRKVLLKKFGHEQTHQIMSEIASFGGLQGIGNIC